MMLCPPMASIYLVEGVRAWYREIATRRRQWPALRWQAPHYRPIDYIHTITSCPQWNSHRSEPTSVLYMDLWSYFLPAIYSYPPPLWQFTVRGYKEKYMYMCMCIYICVCMCAWVWVGVYVYIYAYIYIYVYIYICICMLHSTVCKCHL